MMFSCIHSGSNSATRPHVGRQALDAQLAGPDTAGQQRPQPTQEGGKFCPRSDVLGGDSRSQASWMLYSSLKRTTTLMFTHIRASSFSTLVASDASTLAHALHRASGGRP